MRVFTKNIKFTFLLLSVLTTFPSFSYGQESIEKQTQIPAPEISFTDATGAIKQLSDFKGKTVVLSFWATWCAPCLIELPMMDRLQEKMGDNVLILPVALEPQGAALVQRFYTKANIKNLPIYIDKKREAQSIYKLRALPMTFVINQEGMIVGKVEGAMDWDTKEIKDYLESL